jgi:sialic acid synthase SpsE/protoporphyrinogen oxidase
MEKKIVIIGAGPTGLSTALSLLEKTNIEVEIFEAEEFVGGLATSQQVDGMIYDWGPHIFHSNIPEITKYWKDNFSDLLLEKDFIAKNYKDGILYDYPITLDAIEKFPEIIKKKVKKELSEINPENIKRARNFKECVIELVGPTLQEIFFENYTKKLWGIDPKDMSANWAPKRIELRAKQKAFWAGQFSAIGKYGAGKIWERHSEKIKNRNGKIHLSKKLIKCELKEGNLINLVFNDGTKYNVSDKIVVSTISLDRICKVLEIPCKLTFNSVRLVFIVLNKKYALTEGIHSIYFAHDNLHFHRVTEQKQFSDYGYPENKTILTFEVSYTARKYLGEMSDEQIVREIFEQFIDIGMAEKKNFIKGFSIKLPNVNPVMKIGYEDELAFINSKINKIENLHLAGGSAEFTYGDVQSMVARGWDMANLLSSKHYEINKNLKVGTNFEFNKKVEIYNFAVGGENPTLLIAEIGINHAGNLELAKKLVSEVKKNGCDIAKIQTYEKGSRVSDQSFSAKYADRTLGMEESFNEMFNRFSLNEDEQQEIFKYAKDINMPLMSTPFDEKSVNNLINLGVKAFKIASFDIVNIPFLRYVASTKLPLILSTGMSGMSEIEDALDAISKEKNRNVILLHCVSAYPASYLDSNLRAIETLKKAFGLPVGFSDHSINLLCSTVALALKADVIERHFTMDRFMEGPDHILSSDPKEMLELVKLRNKIYLSLGNGVKKPASIEIQQINKQRKSLFSKKSIKKGEMLSLENITIKGPGLGLMPKFLPIILGKKAARDILQDSAITFDDLMQS